MRPAHGDVVREQFSQQGAAFEDPARSFGQREVLDWIRTNTPVDAGDVVLDVAAGTGLAGRALASEAAAVVAIDLTPEMLAEGKRAAETAGLHNIVFQEGDATALPFLDQSFDRVICRLAVHHYEDSSVPLKEMFRVCRGTGTVTVIDMVAPDALSAARFNELEHLRDPSHTRALTSDDLQAAIQAAGGTISHISRRDNVLDGLRWLDQTAAPAPARTEILDAWEAELSGGPTTGMQPRRTDTGIQFLHVWVLVVAAPSAA